MEPDLDLLLLRLQMAPENQIKQALDEIVRLHSSLDDEECAACRDYWPCDTIKPILIMLNFEW